MNRPPRSLIIIPTYNEVDNLTPLVDEIQALDCGFEILVIDDNSPDGTGQIAERLSAERGGIYVLHRPGKMGLGTAYVTGFRWALEQGYDYVFEMDCDFSHHPRYLPTFLQEIQEADLVIGSRYEISRKVVAVGHYSEFGNQRMLLRGCYSFLSPFVVVFVGTARTFRESSVCKRRRLGKLGARAQVYQLGWKYVCSDDAPPQNPRLHRRVSVLST